MDGVPSSTFVPIHFAPKKYGCNSTETRFPTGGFACRLDGKPLQILVSPKIEASPDAMHFASRFRLDDNDYEKLFQAWRDADGDAKVAACRWLQREGTARWGSWIRFSKQVRMIENFPPMTGCFPTFYLFLLLSSGRYRTGWDSGSRHLADRFRRHNRKCECGSLAAVSVIVFLCLPACRVYVCVCVFVLGLGIQNSS